MDGNGSAYDGGNQAYHYYAGGGAGIIGGSSSYQGDFDRSKSDTKGESGTGGLLMLYADTLYNSGEIVSEGSNGAGGTFKFYRNYNGAVGGAGSGGGSINIFAKCVAEEGKVSVEGGKGGKVSGTGANMGLFNGADGGEGSYTINEVGSYLNYSEKTVTLNINDTYKIDTAKMSYVKLDEEQTEELILGTITYEVEDTNILSVDSLGNLTPNSLGTTRVKVTDLTNEYTTYIIVKVINGKVASQIKEGTDFTLALKENGTVWAYGNNGILAVNEPTQIMISNQELKNIVDIGAGNKISIALSDSGKVYTWSSANKEPKLEENLSNIIKVDAYEDKFLAIDNEGKAYVWNIGNASINKLESDIKYIDVDGEWLLGENGLVYDISKPNERVPYLSNIGSISCGDNHYLATSMTGLAFSLGTGDKGQLGNGKTEFAGSPVVVRKDTGMLENIIAVSAGAKTSIVLTLDGTAYTFGDNENQILGVNGTNVIFATPITEVQDKDENILEMPKLEVIETGKSHSSIADTEGFVYSVGINTSGQLGTEDNTDKIKFTKIGHPEIMTKPKILNIPVRNIRRYSYSTWKFIQFKVRCSKGNRCRCIYNK